MKRYFLSRSGREKALLLAFAGIAAIIWLSLPETLKRKTEPVSLAPAPVT